MLQDIFPPIIFVQFITCTANLCGVGFQLQAVSYDGNLLLSSISEYYKYLICNSHE